MLRRLAGLAVVLPLLLSNVACSTDIDDRNVAAEDDEIRRGGLARQDLAAGAFHDRAEELGQEWLDNNIMTGDARLDAGKLRGTLSPSSLSKFATKMVTDHLKRSEQTINTPDLQTPRFTDRLLKDAGRAVAVDGFVFAPSADNISPIEDNVRELTAFLGDTSKLDAVTLKAKIKDADTDHDQVSLWVFVNRDTKEFVAFYAREGST